MIQENFDAIQYFTELADKNKMARRCKFVPRVISTTEDLTGLLDDMKEHDRFIAISDTTTGNVSSPDGAYGFSKRRAYTVFLLSGFYENDMESRQQELDVCRELFKQFLKRIIRDKYLYDEKQMFFDTRSIPNQELGRNFYPGMTGLHFTLYVQEPIDLCYDENEWEEE